METAVGFSNIMPKTNLQASKHQSIKVYLRPPDFFFISELPKGTQWKDTQLCACFLRIKQWS